MELTYRTRRRLQRAGIIALAVVLASTAIWACWLVWLERHIVYSRDGAVIDFELTSRDPGEGQLALPPEDQENVSVYYNDGSDVSALDISLRQISGYYITSDMLASDLDTIRATVAALPVGSAVMMEVKTIKGTFNYTTGIEGASLTSSVNTAGVDTLIEEIAARNLYFIASTPAFRDRAFGLEHPNYGLPYIGGNGALWVDESSCYWLDPTKDGTLNYLTQVATELRMRGFDEVLFTDFRFPETDQVDFSRDKEFAIRNASADLVEACATERFAVSFLASDSTVEPVAGRSRLYLSGVDAQEAAATAAAYTVEDPAINLVFLTDSYDTRYEICSVLRPMDSAAAG